MKLVSLHIDNFGKFNNFDLDFNDGLNQFVKDNGWGKSTLTAFIKVMFYGFDNFTKMRRSAISRGMAVYMAVI